MVNRFFRIFTGIVVCLTVLLSTGIPVKAAEPHENPDTAKIVFSGIALFSYYSGSLDYVLQKNPDEVETRLNKMPFANYPENIDEYVDTFTASIISVSVTIVETDLNLSTLKELMQQSRFKEAIILTSEIITDLSEARNTLSRTIKAVEETGILLDVFSVPETNLLRLKYEEVLAKIAQIYELLDYYEMLMMSMLPEDTIKPPDINMEEFLKSLDINLIQPLKYVEITLEVEPLNPFVGDIVSYRGLLTSEGKPLAGREIDILVGGIIISSIKTNAAGEYWGIFQVPFRYIHQLEVQSIYSPKGNDTGQYIAALSPVIILNVQFYETELDINVEDMAYPGLNTTINGKFNYGENPVPDERSIEIYLDDVLMKESTVDEIFDEEINIDPKAYEGEHILLVSVKAQERYAPVMTSTILIVSLLIPQIEINLKRMAVIPGEIEIGGRVYSKLGPLSNASVEITLGKNRKTTVTSENGNFVSRIGVGITFGLIGEENIEVKVIPVEPWHAPLQTTRSILLVNILNSMVVLAALILAGIYLPGRIKSRLASLTRKRVKPIIPSPEPIQPPSPEYSQAVESTLVKTRSEEIQQEPRERILFWYTIIMKVVQAVTRIIIKPQQTLREFARDSGRLLGPVAKYFDDFTRMVERLLYSRYTPNTVDISSSEELFHQLENIKIQPSVESEPDTNLSTGNLSSTEKEVNIKSTPFTEIYRPKDPIRQIPTWLLLIIMLTIVYFIGVVLLMLSLSGISLSFCLPVKIVDMSDIKKSVTPKGRPL